jgi:general nucleoside transport system permease protein
MSALDVLLRIALSEAVWVTVLTAATPLLLAALGELVAERSGVLNLGVEGMMAMGAACAFAGAALAVLFAAATLGLATNQVASGLALTILGLGLSGLIGAPFVGARRDPIAPWPIPGLADLPFVGRVLFSQDPFVYAAGLLTILIALFPAVTRAGLRLKAVGENHASAHALGLPVLAVRFWSLVFGGACAGLAGAYLSLVYTRFWSPGMTAGRGWIALALVVFAAWRPGLALLGALIFGAASVLELHAQAAQIGIPSQLLAAVPYLATILALVLLSLRRGQAAGAPGSLGEPFLPER